MISLWASADSCSCLTSAPAGGPEQGGGIEVERDDTARRYGHPHLQLCAETRKPDKGPQARRRGSLEAACGALHGRRQSRGQHHRRGASGCAGKGQTECERLRRHPRTAQSSISCLAQIPGVILYSRLLSTYSNQYGAGLPLPPHRCPLPPHRCPLPPHRCQPGTTPPARNDATSLERRRPSHHRYRVYVAHHSPPKDPCSSSCPTFAATGASPLSTVLPASAPRTTTTSRAASPGSQRQAPSPSSHLAAVVAAQGASPTSAGRAAATASPLRLRGHAPRSADFEEVVEILDWLVTEAETAEEVDDYSDDEAQREPAAKRVRTGTTTSLTTSWSRTSSSRASSSETSSSRASSGHGGTTGRSWTLQLQGPILCETMELLLAGGDKVVTVPHNREMAMWFHPRRLEKMYSPQQHGALLLVQRDLARLESTTAILRWR